MIDVNKPVLDVVAGVIWCNDKFLLAHRAPGKHLEGFWEFPGGKIEPGESAESALAREIHEEFGVAIKVGDFIARQSFDYDDRVIILHAYHASAEDQCEAGNSHDKVKWLTSDDLESYRIAPADDFIVKYLKSARS